MTEICFEIEVGGLQGELFGSGSCCWLSTNFLFRQGAVVAVQLGCRWSGALVTFPKCTGHCPGRSLPSRRSGGSWRCCKGRDSVGNGIGMGFRWVSFDHLRLAWCFVLTLLILDWYQVSSSYGEAPAIALIPRLQEFAPKTGGPGGKSLSVPKLERLRRGRSNPGVR